MQNYKIWYWLGLIIFLITAIFSNGYHHYDEHFQILEFCNYKLGLSPSSHLPWEFEAKIRPALQPFIAYSLAKALTAFNLYNPFTLAFLLRLIMAIMSWLAITRLVKLLLPDFQHEWAKLFFIMCSLLLWFVPYTSVRFSAEAFSGTLFCFSLFIILHPNNQSAKRYGLLLLAGALLGFGWFARIQLAFALIGIAIWILFIARWQFRYWILLVLSFIVTVGICLYIDHWFYGEWLFTPYNYYHVNIVQNIAAKFGVSPWWHYFELFLMNGVPPISIVLLVLFFRGVWKVPKHLFTLCCIIFFAGHFAVGHKEMRFLFPMILPFIYIACRGVDNWLHLPRKKLYTIGFKVLVVINIGLLIYRGLSPAQNTVNFYKYVYKQSEHAKADSTILYSIGSSPYNVITLNINFYKHPKLVIKEIDSLNQLPVSTSTTQSSAYFFSPTIVDTMVVNRYGMRPVYSTLPAWLRNFNFNNWQERTKISTLYKLP